MCQRWPATGLVFACLVAAAGCRPFASVDGAAHEYVALARDLIAGRPLSREAVGDLLARVRLLPESDGRRSFLAAQLSGLDRRLRFQSGASTVREEASALGMPLPRFDAARAAAIRQRLDELLTGPGALAERLAAYHREHAVPRSRLDQVTRRLVDDCRARMPESRLADNGVEIRFGVDLPWPAFTSHIAGGRSQIDIRRDVLWTEPALHAVVCHETYPGHHQQNVTWDHLVRTRGWIELGVNPPFTPFAAMAERLAVAGARLALPAGERPVVLQALADFEPLALAVAIDAADGTTTAERARSILRDELLMPTPDEFLAFVQRHRAMAIAYVTPAAGIHDWDSYFAALTSPAKLVEGAAQ